MSATQKQLRDILMTGLSNQESPEAVPGRVSPEGGVGIGAEAVRQALGIKPDEADEVHDDNEIDTAPAEGLDAEPQSPEAVDDTEPAEGADSDGEDGLLTDINALAEGLGVDVAALYDLKIPIPNSEPITFGELKNRYIDGANEQADQTETLNALAEREQALEAREQLAAQSERLPNELLQAEAAVLLAQQAYAGEDWTTLEATSPGQAALKHQKLKEQLEFAVKNRNRIGAELQQLRSDIAKQRESQLSEYHQQRKTNLETYVPDWTQEGARKRDQLAMSEWFASDKPAAPLPGELMDFIYSQAHAGLAAVLRDYWQMKSAVQAAETGQPRKKPRVVRPQSVLATEKGRRANLDRKRKQAKETSDLRKKATFVKDLLLSGTAD